MRAPFPIALPRGSLARSGALLFESGTLLALLRLWLFVELFGWRAYVLTIDYN